MINGFTDTIRVLHVDDEPDIADLSAEFLEREDERFIVETATSASEGLDTLTASEFDCIVSDYDMPGQSGIEFLEAVRNDNPDLPFILFTGKGSEEVASDAISAGVTDYLQKEGGTDQYTVLANRIANAVEHDRSRRLVERSEQRLREIVDSLPHFLYVVDKNGTYRLANEALAEFHDKTVKEIEGANVADVLPPQKAKEFNQNVASVLEQGKSKQFDEVEIPDSNGNGHIVEPRLLPYDFGNTEDRAVLGIAADVTERKARENELEQTRKRMQLALEQTNSIIFEIDCQTGDVVRHGAFCEFFDLDPSEVPTWEDHLEQIVHPDDREQFEQFYRQLIDGEREVGDLEYRTETEGGDVHWIQDTVFVEEDTDTRQVIGIARDITEYKERELELQRKERRYQAVFDDPNILVGLIDTDGSILDINETAMEYVDATRDEVIGEAFWETPWFRHSAAIKERIKTWATRAADGEYVEFEADLVKPTGDGYTVEGVFRPVTNDEGDVVSIIVSDRDATERKQRERELEQYEAYLEGSNDIITVLDESGVVQYQSPSVTRILGFEPGELVGENGFDSVHPDDTEELFATFTDLISNPEQTVTSEARFKAADGEWRWLEIRGQNYLDHPVINGIITNIRDITDRKNYEHELERTNALLSTVFETLPVGVLAEDESRNVLAVNDRLFELFELPGTPDKVIGSNCEDFAEDVSGLFDRPDEFTDRIATLIDEREPIRDEQLQLGDGRTFERRYEPIELPDSEGHLWVYSDITNQKTREERLEALNETTRKLMTAETRQEVAEIGAEAAHDTLDMAANAIYLYDDDRSALVPAAVTEASRELIGEPPTFTEGDSIAWRVYEEGEPVALANIHEDPDIYNPDSPIRSELHLPIEDYGLLLAGSETAEAFDQQNIVIGKILANNIKTALEQVERMEQLRNRERDLRRQNDRLEEFASVVSHDLKNPLQVATGHLELLKEECESEQLDAIERALRRMDALVKDLLTLAREGERVDELEPVNLAELVQNCWQNVKTGDAIFKTLTNQTIHADRSRLKQVFENIIHNAIEHGGDEVRVTVGDLEDGFYVADDGDGIPEDDRESIFEMGYSTVSEGTGFGLPIVKEIVEAHGWEVTVDESQTGGARFNITGVNRA